eukprot:XP_003724918.1 PREDICTED: uncharacterized protein LOC100887949 [Strongylocentrotus purpuratus]
MAATEESKDSPLRSLSSFKSEIPGGDGLGAMDPKNSKSFHQYLDMVINGAVFLFIIVLLVLVICFLVAVELMIAFGVIMDVGVKKDSTLRALSATTLAILAFFVIEVTIRVFSLGAFIKKQKIEMFDIFIVTITFIIDLVLLASNIEGDSPGTRAITLIISFRLWRLCGIYNTGVSKAREQASSELQMEKYARNQAEIQADALQAQCDQQLKEIAHLRDYMRQHSLDPDSPKLGFPLDYRRRYTIAVDFDKADTVRVNDRVNSESSLASAIASLETSTKLESSGRGGAGGSGSRRGQRSDNPPSSSSSTSTPTVRPVQLNNLSKYNSHHTSRSTREGRSNPAYEIEIGEEAKEREGRRGGDRGEEDAEPTAVTGALEGITNLAFEDDRPGDEEMMEIGDGGEVVLPEGPSPSTNNNADDEAQLRLELDEIGRLSDAALLEELGGSSVTQDINGVPTTSL